MDKAKLLSENLHAPSPAPLSAAASHTDTDAAHSASTDVRSGTLSASTPSAKLMEPPAAGALPDDTQLRGRVYQPGEIACRHQNEDLTNCGAEPGEPCIWQQAGEGGTYHAERIEDAAAISRRQGIEPTEDQFDQAVWDSGLF